MLPNKLTAIPSGVQAAGAGTAAAVRRPLASPESRYGARRGYNHGMNTHVRNAGSVVIVDFRGDLVTEDGDEDLREVVRRLIGEGWTRILLNLTHVKRMDSGGVGELVASWKVAHEHGASIKLLRPGDRVKHTLHLSQILPLVEVFEDEHEAVKSFA